ALKAAGTAAPFVSENLPFAVKAVLMRSAKDLQAPVWFQGAGLVDAWAAVKLVGSAAGHQFASGLRRVLRLGEPVPVETWSWVERLKAVSDAEDRAFLEALVPKAPDAAQPSGEEDGEEGERAGGSDEAPPEDEAAAEQGSDGHAAQNDAIKRFNAAR